MKRARPNRHLPPLHFTAEEFDRLVAVADAQGTNLALFVKRAAMRAVARQEAFARLSGHGNASEGPDAAQGAENGSSRRTLRLNGHAAAAASLERNTP